MPCTGWSDTRSRPVAAFIGNLSRTDLPRKRVPRCSPAGTFPLPCRHNVQYHHYDKEHPMKTKTLFLFAILVLGTILSACSPVPVTVQTPAAQRTITVTGTGKVTLTPDIAYISIGVHTENPSATQAVSGNNTQAQAVIAAIKGFGVADKDIQTTDFSINPQQQTDENGKVTGILYVVDNTVYVTVRDLTKLGELLDSTDTAGANNINSIQLDVADKTAALSQAPSPPLRMRKSRPMN